MSSATITPPRLPRQGRAPRRRRPAHHLLDRPPHRVDRLREARERRHDVVIAGAWWLIAAAVAWQTRRRPHVRATPLLLVVDLAFTAAPLMTTGGVASVYFSLLVMPPFAAHLLYGRRAILWTAGGGVVIYVATLLVTHVTNDPRLMIMRFGAVVLLAVAVLSRAAHEERVQRDIEQLATWPQTVGADREAVARALLEEWSGPFLADALRERLQTAPSMARKPGERNDEACPSSGAVTASNDASSISNASPSSCAT